MTHTTLKNSQWRDSFVSNLGNLSVNGDTTYMHERSHSEKNLNRCKERGKSFTYLDIQIQGGIYMREALCL